MASVAKIRRDQVFPRLTNAILLHKPGRDITAFHTLRGRKSGSPPGLGFDSAGLNVLTLSINDEFADFGVVMLPTDVDNPKKVKRVAHLSAAIWNKVPLRHRGKKKNK